MDRSETACFFQRIAYTDYILSGEPGRSEVWVLQLSIFLNKKNDVFQSFRILLNQGITS